MNRTILFLVVLLSSYTLAAQGKSEQEAAVRNMENVEVQALLRKDTEALKKIWANNLTVNAPLNAVFVGGQIERIKSGVISYSSFTRNIENVLVLDDVVITMGNETMVPADSAPMSGQTVRRRYTNIWTNEKGTWLLVARHASIICEPGKATAAANKD